MRRSLRSTIMVLTVLFGGALFLAAEGSAEAKPSYPGVEGRITVYLSGPEPMLRQLESAFEAERGDVLEFVILGCGPLRQRVWTEFESGQINADVFWGSDPLVYIALDKRGALEAYKPKGVEKIRDIHHSGANYTLVNERYCVIIYNTETVTADRRPVSFEDLRRSEFKGTIIHADPDQSSQALALVCGLWEMKGRSWDFYRGLVGNKLYLAKKNSEVPSKIMEKEFAVGIAPHDEATRILAKAKKEGYPACLAICWPQEGALAVQRPIAISRNDARPAANARIAHEFVDFMVSVKAQEITSAFGFVSVRKDIPAPSAVPPDLKITRVDWGYLSAHQDEIRSGFKALF